MAITQNHHTQHFLGHAQDTNPEAWKTLIRQDTFSTLPQHIPLPLVVGVVHNDAFSGTGIPAIAFTRALAKLWNQGIKLRYLGGFAFEPADCGHPPWVAAGFVPRLGWRFPFLTGTAFLLPRPSSRTSAPTAFGTTEDLGGVR